MLSPGHYYPEQAAAAEPVVLFVRRHWFAFVGWALLIAVMALVPIPVLVIVGSTLGSASASASVRALVVFGISMYLLMTLAIFLVAWIDFYLDSTIVTEKRLVDVHQNGLFNHRVSEQSLLKVQDVTVRVRGPWQTFFQFGTVYVETAGEAPNFEMNNLPHPHHVANTITELHNRLLEQGFTSGSDQGKHQPVGSDQALRRIRHDAAAS